MPSLPMTMLPAFRFPLHWAPFWRVLTTACVRMLWYVGALEHFAGAVDRGSWTVLNPVDKC